MNSKTALSDDVASAVRNVEDFPKPGILFKDITTLMKHPKLCSRIVDELVEIKRKTSPTGILGIESRGFFFAPTVAFNLGVPFLPVRKKGKLPAQTITASYDLEYGKSEIEIHTDALSEGDSVWIHDDLLATGGTAAAAAKLVEQRGAIVAGFSFIIDIGLNDSHDHLKPYSSNIVSILSVPNNV